MPRPCPTVFFTSDLHIGHEKVAEIRGFDSAGEHDYAVFTAWARTVSPGDRVYVLGDLTGDARSLDRAVSLLNDLPGEKHLVAGNHDACHPMNRNAHKALPTYLEAFASVQSNARFKGYGIDVLLSHFPYTRDRGETRYAQWRLPNLGEWLLHGHTHGTERVSTTDDRLVASHAFHGTGRVVPGEREIHVGLDAWGLSPVPLDTIADLIKEHTS